MTALQYLLEVSICLSILYAFYYYSLRKETFFQLNRIYLLSSPFLALSIPLIHIQLYQRIEPSSLEIIYPIVENAALAQGVFWRQMYQSPSGFELTIADIIWGIYLIGAAWMLVKLIHGLWQLSSLIKASQQKREQHFTLVETREDIPAASFFSYVFWNRNQLPEEKKIILEHELVHVRQKHSIDVLLMELWVIIKWFNPIIYWYRRSLKMTHEYIADRYMVQQMGSPLQYANFLATQQKAVHSSPLASNFASMLRKRLKMLASDPSQSWKLGKYFMSLGIVFLLMLLFSFNLSEQLPTKIKQPFILVDQYVEQISQQNLLQGKISISEVEIATSTPLEEPTSVEKELTQTATAHQDEALSQYLSWETQQIEAHSLSGERANTLKIPAQSIPFELFQSIQQAQPEFYIKEEKQEIERLSISRMHSLEQKDFCESINWPKDDCFTQLTKEAQAGEQLLLMWRTPNNQAYISILSLDTAATEVSIEHFPKDITERIGMYSRKPVIMPRIPKPIFRESVYDLEWGAEKILIVGRGQISLNLERFQNILSQEVILTKNGEALAVKSFQVTSMQHGESKAFFSMYQDWSPELYNQYNREEQSLSAYMQDYLIQQYYDGYTHFSFIVWFTREDRSDTLESLVTFSIAIQGEEASPDDFSAKGFEIDPGINQFQLINRPGEPTVIKIDTTNQKYRWMYDLYKVKEGFEIVHIPNFKTIHRVLTLEDIVLPKAELDTRVRLKNPLLRVDHQAEYYDFKGKLIQLQWRGFEGISDNSMYPLRKFQAAKDKSLYLKIDQKFLDIYQYDLIFVPQSGDGIRYVLSNPELEEIEQVIRSMGPRTSIFIKNILIKENEGILHFPLTFAFHLH